MAGPPIDGAGRRRAGKHRWARAEHRPGAELAPTTGAAAPDGGASPGPADLEPHVGGPRLTPRKLAAAIGLGFAGMVVCGALLFQGGQDPAANDPGADVAAAGHRDTPPPKGGAPGSTDNRSPGLAALASSATAPNGAHPDRTAAEGAAPAPAAGAAPSSGPQATASGQQPTAQGGGSGPGAGGGNNTPAGGPATAGNGSQASGDQPAPNPAASPAGAAAQPPSPAPPAPASTVVDGQTDGPHGAAQDDFAGPTPTAEAAAAAPGPVTRTAPPTAAVPKQPTTAGGCVAGYDPCIPPGPDVDCAGGSGNGPRYVTGPVKVSGADPFGLDADHDGIGCE